MSRRIWLCADDYGISPGVNRAIRELIERNRLNATSVMTVGPSIDRPINRPGLKVVTPCARGAGS